MKNRLAAKLREGCSKDSAGSETQRVNLLGACAWQVAAKAVKAAKAAVRLKIRMGGRDVDSRRRTRQRPNGRSQLFRLCNAIAEPCNDDLV